VRGHDCLWCRLRKVSRSRLRILSRPAVTSSSKDSIGNLRLQLEDVNTCFWCLRGDFEIEGPERPGRGPSQWAIRSVNVRLDAGSSIFSFMSGSLVAGYHDRARALADGRGHERALEGSALVQAYPALQACVRGGWFVRLSLDGCAMLRYFYGFTCCDLQLGLECRRCVFTPAKHMRTLENQLMPCCAKRVADE